MLQDNPYAFDPSNPSSGGAPPVPPTPPSSPAGGFDPSASGQYMPSQPPVTNSVTPPPVFNPLNDTSNTAPVEAPSYTSSIPPAISPDLGDTQLEGGRKAPNKKILVVLVVILLLLGIIGGGAFALMSGLIKNPFGGDTPPVSVVPPPPAEPTPPPPDPQPVPEPPPAPEPPPIQSNDDMRVSDINILATGLNSYSISHAGVYPSTGDQLTHIFPTSTPCFELIAESFIPTCPTDPAGEPAFYGYRSDGASYELTAKLDDTTCTYPGATLNGSICLYGVVGGSTTQP